MVTIISQFSFNTAWLSPKFVYDTFIAKNPIKGVHNPHKCNQQHLETITVPLPPPTHTLFSCKFYITKCKSVTDPLSDSYNGREGQWALSGLKKISCIKQHTLQLSISLNSWTGKEHASAINITGLPSCL